MLHLESLNCSYGFLYRLYFTKIQIGTPPKDYHVQIDTGSDLLWVNCAGCQKCPKKSDLGVCSFSYLYRFLNFSGYFT